MIAGSLPDYMLLCDYNDVIGILEATGRTVPRESWADECFFARQQQKLESLI